MSEDWLDEVKADKTAMAEVNAMVEKLRIAQFEKDNAEAVLNEATNRYQKIVQEVCQCFRNNGLEALKCSDGHSVEITSNVRCSIKKDAASKAEVAKWLRDRGMENLVSSELIVMPSQAEKLRKMNVPFDEETTMNTNSVKAYVRSELNQGSMTRDDIPKGLSWFEYDDVVIKEGV
jgi:hypothetical protein